jgi:hypothetical protein
MKRQLALALAFPIITVVCFFPIGLFLVSSLLEKGILIFSFVVALLISYFISKNIIKTKISKLKTLRFEITNDAIVQLNADTHDVRILFSSIKKIIEKNNGILINTQGRNKILFIPKRIDNFDDLKIELLNQYKCR